MLNKKKKINVGFLGLLFLILLLVMISVLNLSEPEETVRATEANAVSGSEQTDIQKEARAQEFDESEFANVLDYGAEGDGESDDTSEIQSALDENESVYIPDGTYLIDVDRSLKLASDQTLVLSDNAVLVAIPTSTEANAVILIAGVDNVSVSGGQIVGEREDHYGDSGEWGMGLRISDGASNINISEMAVSDCWGDGIYVGSEVGEARVDSVTIDNVVSDNNRRQGLSITNAEKVTVSNSVFKNTNGTEPEAGIDLEPNRIQDTDDIVIMNTQCYGNDGAGLVMNATHGEIQRVEVTDCTFSDNKLGLALIMNASDLTFKNISISDNWNGIEVSGDVSNTSFENFEISGNYTSGDKVGNYLERLLQKLFNISG